MLPADGEVTADRRSDAGDRSAAPIATGLRGRPVSIGRRWPVLLMFVVATGLAWIRVPSGQRNTLYAEDGALFLIDWAARGRVSLFWAPYAGYQHLVPRTVAWFVTTFLPVAWWGLAVTAIACAIVGAIAALVFAFSAEVTGYYPARVVLGLIVVLIPVAGLEPLGNLANLHWFVLYLMPWVLIARPRSTAGLVSTAALALVATLTEPQCLVFAPLALWVFITVRRTRLVSIAWAVGMAGQTLTYLVAPRVDNPGRPPLASVAEGYVVDAGMSILTSRSDILGWTIVTIGWWVGFAFVLALLVFAGIGFWLGRRTARAMLASLVVGSVASWVLGFVVNNVPAFYFSVMTPEQLAHPPLLRWGTAASAMLAATLPITIGVLVERRPGWWPAAITALTVFGLLLLVDVTNHLTVPGQPWSAQIESAELTCERTPDATVLIYTQPAYPTWGVNLPCVVIAR